MDILKVCGCLREETAKINAIAAHNKNRKSFGEANFNKLFRAYIKHAKERKYPFFLTKEQFLILTSGNCYYCGIIPQQISNAMESYGAYIYNGVDRVDNFLGYSSDNCVSCCGVCNRAKDVMGIDVFLAWVKRIYKNRC